MGDKLKGAAALGSTVFRLHFVSLRAGPANQSLSSSREQRRISGRNVVLKLAAIDFARRSGRNLPERITAGQRRIRRSQKEEIRAIYMDDQH